MKKILILGAGRSSGVLIQYLLEQSLIYKWQIIVGDAAIESALSKIANHPNGTAIKFNIQEEENIIAKVDLVISLLPPDMHFWVAEKCIKSGKSLLTASYISDIIQGLNEAVIKKGILIMMECGLDPGIDHMSAMKIIDEIKESGGHITLFKSYTGGLVAPESDDNPWHYKITWNPKNVVLAGKGGTAQYLEEGSPKYISYHQLFRRVEKIEVDGYGIFEGYANRDSISYKTVYGLDGIQTLLRGTLRKEGFCSAWDLLVQLGMTDDNFILKGSEQMTYKEFTSSFLPSNNVIGLKSKLAGYFQLSTEDPAINKLEWLGLFSDEKINKANVSPAAVLQGLMEQKWKFGPHDKDMIVMQHIFNYEIEGKKYEKLSSLVVIGKNSNETAMATTVGLPLGIVAKLILTGQLKLTGVKIPVMKEVYLPVLEELKTKGITFTEKEINLK